ncbi:MAG: Asp/Glu racemase [Betaproteobacteria bacterium]|nr:MAG: Asp/Glu racemase [Betaproteobacteria bacterium]
MKTRLIINPNTTESVTDRLLTVARGVQRNEFPSDVTTLLSATASFGGSYISDEVGYAIGGHATLEAWRRVCESGSTPSAALIGCFGDPGLWALREMSGIPVTGLAEASFIEAVQHGAFAVVTGGARWKPMLERLAGALDFANQMQTIHTIEATGAQLAADPEAAIVLLGEACAAVARQANVRSIILGGAGLAGYAAKIAAASPALGVPLIDSAEAGARRLLQL